MAIRYGSTAEDHVAQVAERGLLGNHGGVLAHRQALPRQGRLGGLQSDRLKQPRICGNGVALFDQNDIARHQFARSNALLRTITNNACLWRRHALQGRHGLLCARLLHVSHDGVEQQHGQDRDRLVRKSRFALYEPEAGRDRSCNEQQDDEHILKLLEKPAPCGSGLLGGKLVAAIARESGVSLLLSKAAVRVTRERSEHIRRGCPIGDRLPAHAPRTYWFPGRTYNRTFVPRSPAGASMTSTVNGCDIAKVR